MRRHRRARTRCRPHERCPHPSGDTVSEIIAANASGTTLVYTDSLLSEVGFLAIDDPTASAPLGKLG